MDEGDPRDRVREAIALVTADLETDVTRWRETFFTITVDVDDAVASIRSLLPSLPEGNDPALIALLTNTRRALDLLEDQRDGLIGLVRLLLRRLAGESPEDARNILWQVGRDL